MASQLAVRGDARDNPTMRTPISCDAGQEPRRLIAALIRTLGCLFAVLVLSVILTSTSASICAAAAGPAGETPSGTSPAAAGVRIFYVIRHVDRTNEPPEDPLLSEAGVARAEVLARTLGSSGLSGIFVSNTRRSHDSVAPLANEIGLIPHEYSADDPYGAAKAALELGGPVALIVGHGDTVERIIEGLGVSPPPDLGYVQYNDLFVVARPASGPAAWSQLNYGATIEP
ncbi:MAG: histidine phosphatase family protein [Candidatus Eisenbacteria bacterium]|nr:histidine phosphatase family protein [Candidatus Eisenbacteria bacterium]